MDEFPLRPPTCMCSGKARPTLARDVSLLVTVEQLRTWVEAQPADYTTDGFGGDCLLERYLADVLGVNRIHAGWICGRVYTGDTVVHLDWGRSPLSRRAVDAYDFYRIAHRLNTVTRAQLLEIIDALDS